MLKIWMASQCRWMEVDSGDGWQRRGFEQSFWYKWDVFCTKGNCSLLKIIISMQPPTSEYWTKKTIRFYKSAIADWLLTTYVKLSALQAERTVDKRLAIRMILPVLPEQAYALCPWRLFDIFAQQKDGITRTLGAAHIVMLDECSGNFKHYVGASTSSQIIVQKYGDRVANGGGVFQSYLAPFYRRFGHLVCFWWTYNRHLRHGIHWVRNLGPTIWYGWPLPQYVQL